jgi:hypothetical protein
LNHQTDDIHVCKLQYLSIFDLSVPKTLTSLSKGARVSAAFPLDISEPLSHNPGAIREIPTVLSRAQAAVVFVAQ